MARKSKTWDWTTPIDDLGTWPYSYWPSADIRPGNEREINKLIRRASSCIEKS